MKGKKRGEREKRREETRSNNNACFSRDKSGRYGIAILQLIPIQETTRWKSFRESFPFLFQHLNKRLLNTLLIEY